MVSDDNASIIEKALDMGRSNKDIATDLADDGLLNNSHLGAIGSAIGGKSIKNIKKAIIGGDVDSVKEVVDFATEKAKKLRAIFATLIMLLGGGGISEISGLTDFTPLEQWGGDVYDEACPNFIVFNRDSFNLSIDDGYFVAKYDLDDNRCTNQVAVDVLFELQSMNGTAISNRTNTHYISGNVSNNFEILVSPPEAGKYTLQLIASVDGKTIDENTWNRVTIMPNGSGINSDIEGGPQQNMNNTGGAPEGNQGQSVCIIELWEQGSGHYVEGNYAEVYVDIDSDCESAEVRTEIHVLKINEGESPELILIENKTWEVSGYQGDWNAHNMTLEVGNYDVHMLIWHDGGVHATEEMSFVVGGNSEEPITGCTDTVANNYNEDAEEDDGSCEYEEEEELECAPFFYGVVAGYVDSTNTTVYLRFDIDCLNSNITENVTIQFLVYLNNSGIGDSPTNWTEQTYPINGEVWDEYNLTLGNFTNDSYDLYAYLIKEDGLIAENGERKWLNVPIQATNASED